MSDKARQELGLQILPYIKSKKTAVEVAGNYDAPLVVKVLRGRPRHGQTHIGRAREGNPTGELRSGGKVCLG